MDLQKRENETPFEWELRLCLAKRRHEIDNEWKEIVDILGLDITSDTLRKRASGYERYDSYIKGFDDSCTTILSVSDLHVPFQLPKELLHEYVGRTDILQINGDIVDCQALSKFSKLYRISPMEEMIEGRQYLIDLIEYIKPKKVVVNYGNHDIRFANYFAKNLDTDILELMPNTSLELIFEDGFKHYDKRNHTKIYYPPLKNEFSNIEIEFVDDWKVKIGSAWFVHPIAYRSGILATADRAKDYFQDTTKEPFDTIIMAHTHKVADSKKGFIRLIEQGAFCYVDKMNYNDGKLYSPQKEGFAVICEDKNGNVIQDKTRVVSLN